MIVNHLLARRATLRNTHSLRNIDDTFNATNRTNMTSQQRWLPSESALLPVGASCQPQLHYVVVWGRAFSQTTFPSKLRSWSCPASSPVQRAVVAVLGKVSWILCGVREWHRASGLYRSSWLRQHFLTHRVSTDTTIQRSESCSEWVRTRGKCVVLRRVVFGRPVGLLETSS